MVTLRPTEKTGVYSDGIIFEDVEEQLPLEDVEGDFDENNQPVYIEDANPEEQYHKFLLTQQSTFEEALQKPTEEELAEQEAQNDRERIESSHKDSFFEESIDFREPNQGNVSNAGALRAGSGVEEYANVDEKDRTYTEESHAAEVQNIFKHAKSEDEKLDRIDNSESSEIVRIQGLAEEDNLGESQQFEIENKSLTKAPGMDQFEKSMEFGQEQNFNDEDEHNEMLTKTIKTPISVATSPTPRVRSNSASSRKLASSTQLFRHKNGSANHLASTNNFALQSTNDFKYIGNQFKVGRIDPGLMSSCEKHFLKLNQKKLAYLYENNKYLNCSLSPRSSASNDDKWKGLQFRMGKFGSSAAGEGGMTFEQRFQGLFRQKLDLLKPKPRSGWPSYAELRHMHDKLLPGYKIEQ